MAKPFALLLATISLTAAAHAVELRPDNQAKDWLTATETERLTWVIGVSGRLKQAKVTPLNLYGCLTTALTVRNRSSRDERAATEMLKHNTLAEVTALCAVMVVAVE